MTNPAQITFRNMEPSAALEARIVEKTAKLRQLCDRITGCHVVVEQDHHHHHKGNLFHVRIDVVVPDAELVVSQAPTDPTHADAYVAVRDAFEAMRRQLQRHVEAGRPA